MEGLNKQGNRAAIYVRVSTLDQAREGYSLAAQRKTLMSAAEHVGYTDLTVYEDAGLSGKDINHRPAMRRLLDDIGKGKQDALLVWALSRLTRSLADLLMICNLLDKHGVRLISQTEYFDTTTPTGRAMLGILGVFAQMEREITAERTQAAMLERASQGKRTCADVLGYDLDGRDNLKINPAEAERVRYIYDRYIDYHNLSAVAELCGLKGYIGKRGRVFKAQHIKTILTRPIYAGYYSYHQYLFKGNFEPIIPIGIHDMAQKLLKMPTIGEHLIMQQDGINP